MGFVYILKSDKNSTYYVGSTSNLERRMEEHTSGRSKYTGGILPVKLVFYQQYPTLVQARKVEYKLKKLKRKDILERIIADGRIVLGP